MKPALPLQSDRLIRQISVGPLTLCRRFMTWWLHELWNCLPAGAIAAFSQKQTTLLVTVSESDLTVDCGALPHRHTLARLSLSDESEEALGSIRSSIEDTLDPAERNTIVNVAPEQALRRTITLPLAAEENLREVISFELDRFTPLREADAWFDFHIVGSDPESQTLTIDLAVIRRELGERALGIARQLGFTPQSLQVSDRPVSPDDKARTFRFWQPTVPARSWRRGIIIGLWVVALLVAAAAIYLPIHQKQQLLSFYEDVLVQRRLEANAALARSAELDDLTAKALFVQNRKAATISAIEILDEVTRRLPDDSWLLQLRVRNDRLAMSGYSASTASLIGILESSDLFEDVQFDSPVTRDARVGLDRFTLSASVLSGEAKQ